MYRIYIYLRICMDDHIDQIHHHAYRAAANYQLQRETKPLISRTTIIVMHTHTVSVYFSFFHVESINVEWEIYFHDECTGYKGICYKRVI